MERMTKEELIKFFLKQLGDNEVLGEWLSKVEIEDKLNNMIENITYEAERANYVASWLPRTGTLNFDLDKKYNDELVIVHELLHVLSTSVLHSDAKKLTLKCGLLFINCQKKGENVEVKGTNNRGINEGITESLAEQIIDESSIGYEIEKSVYKILTIIINKKMILDQYFNDKVKTESINLFSNDIIKKYGLRLGKKLNDNIRKVLKLLDKYKEIDNLSNIFGITTSINQREIKKEIYNTLTEMVESIIDKEDDFMKKISIMVKSFPTEISVPISKKVLNELVNKKEWDLRKKIDILYSIRKEKNAYIPINILETLLLENDSISYKEKLNTFLELYTDIDEFKDSNMVYELYSKIRDITENVLPKREIFKNIINNDEINTIEDIDNILGKIKYRKVGDYYEICGTYKKISGQVYDNSGKYVKVQVLNFNPFKDETIQNPEALPDYLSEDGVCTVFNEIKKKFEQYNSSILSKEKYYTTYIEVIGNILRLSYYPFFVTNDEEKIYKECFEIKPNGELEEILCQDERRLIDDVTNLNLTVKEETSDVSTIEIKQEAEILNELLKKSKVDNEKGDDSNVK